MEHTSYHIMVGKKFVELPHLWDTGRTNLWLQPNPNSKSLIATMEEAERLIRLARKIIPGLTDKTSASMKIRRITIQDYPV